MNVQNLRGRVSASFKARIVASLVVIATSLFGAEPLPMTDRSVSAFFRFDDPSVWGKDSGPLGSSLTSKSGSSSAGLKTGDGSLGDAGCLYLPYASRDWSLSGYTYTPSTVSGTIAGSVPDLGNPSNGWTLALWVRLDKNMLEQRTTLKGASLKPKLSTLIDAVKLLGGEYGDEIKPYEELIDSDVWNHVALTYNPANPTEKHAYTMYLNCGAGGGNSGLSTVMNGGVQKGVVPYTIPLTLNGSSVTLGGNLGADLEEPVEVLGITLKGITIACFGKIDDVAIINRCMTSNDIVRLSSRGETYVWLTRGDAVGKYSFSANHNWSSTQSKHASLPPQAGLDYLVDLGDDAFVRTQDKAGLSSVFGGQSLTLGRVGGDSGGLYHLGNRSAIQVDDFRINNGIVKVGAADAVLSGNVTLKTPSSDPLVICSDGSESSYNWNAAILDGTDGGADILAKTDDGSIDVRFDFDSRFYAGRLIADGANATVRISPSTLMALFGDPRLDAVILRNGATLAPAADGDELKSAIMGVTADGVASVFVPDGETFTLSVPLTGSFVKTGGGELVLDQVGGSGRIDLAEGTLTLTPGTEQRLGRVTGGRLRIAGKVDAFAKAESFVLLSVPLADREISASDFNLVPSTALGYETSVRIEIEDGMQTAWIDVGECDRYVIAQDTFEDCPLDSAAEALFGWSGEGSVVLGSPILPTPPSYALDGVEHSQVMSFEESVTRTYADNFARDNQMLDVLFQVCRGPLNASACANADVASGQVSFGVDEDGCICVYHPDATGAGIWSKLSFGSKSSFTNGEWVRLTCIFDYCSNADGKGFVQVRANGNCGVSPDGVRSPTDGASNGSWFHLFDKNGVSEGKVAQLGVYGETQVDDVVVSAYKKSLKPETHTCEDTTVDYSGTYGSGKTAHGKISYAQCDAKGIPRDLDFDSDGDGVSNGVELLKRTDPLDPDSFPGGGMAIIVR